MTTTPKPFKFRRRTTVPGIAREMLRCFEDPKRWTQFAPARTASGERTCHDDPLARSFCAIGAARAIADLDGGESIRSAAGSLGFNIVVVNNIDGLPALRRVLRKLARPRRRS